MSFPLCMDPEVAAIREKEELKRLEQQLENMLLSPYYRQLIKELDYEGMCSGLGRIEIIRLLCNINHYDIERDNMVVLKPGKA